MRFALCCICTFFADEVTRWWVRSCSTKCDTQIWLIDQFEFSSAKESTQNHLIPTFLCDQTFRMWANSNTRPQFERNSNIHARSDQTVPYPKEFIFSRIWMNLNHRARPHSTLFGRLRMFALNHIFLQSSELESLRVIKPSRICANSNICMRLHHLALAWTRIFACDYTLPLLR